MRFKKMLLGIAFAAVLFACDCSRTKAAFVPEIKYQEIEPYALFYPQIVRCTCYCEHQGTATLKMPYYGVIAGREDWMWDMAEINAINPDGSVGEFIGYYEFRDTGAGMDTDQDGKGDSIERGMSVDIWVSSMDEAYAWRDKYGDYIYIKLIKAKG